MHTLEFDTGCALTVYGDGLFDIRLGDISLVQCFPGMDGTPLGRPVQVTGVGTSTLSVSYPGPECTLVLHWSVRDGMLCLIPELEELSRSSAEKLSVLQEAVVAGAEKVLAHGYFSWDQSFLLPVSDIEQTTGSGVTALLGKESVGLVGYLVHDRLYQSFLYRGGGNQVRLTTESYLEGKDLKDIRSFRFPEMVFFRESDLEEGQRRWAGRVAEENRISLTKPPVRGWCSWYYDYFWFSGDILEDHLRDFASFRESLNLDVFVIDANHFEHLGDWLHPDPKFHKGLEYYAGRIREAGYIPGIWIGPWMVADRSRVFREHPEWLCRDEQGELIEFMNPLGEDNVWGYRSKIHYCLDTSHPDAFAYLREVFRTLYGWGFRYFKTDFMYWGSMDRFEGGWFHEGINAHNLIPDKADQPWIRRHAPGKTRMEYFTDVLRMIREEIGPESIWLGCGQPIWASAGYVDCMRVSRDVGARWEAHNSPKELLNDLALRNFTNRRFYEVDPDCVLLRDFETKITETEATSLALYMGVAQGMILTSDHLHRCPEHRLELFRFIQGDREAVDFRPRLLGREEELILYSGFNRDKGVYILFLFNNGEEPVEKRYTLESVGVRGEYGIAWGEGDEPFPVEDSVQVSLEPHASRLIYFSEKPFPNGWKPERITG